MSPSFRSLSAAIIVGLIALLGAFPCPASAASKAQIDRDVDKALQELYASSRAAKLLASEAKGILVFPSIVKAGFVVGVQVATGPCANMAGLPATTTPLPHRTVCRRASRNSAMHCSSCPTRTSAT
ncbi:MAG: hypothetical protein VB050_06975 [Geobacteraceae bacterium]|nr:hypothetical protein [Geobacteraceae bacterium]